MLLSRRRAWALGASAAVAAIVAGSFGPVVRSVLAKEAAKRRLEIEVGAVRPAFFAVRLLDVRVRLAGVTGIEVGVPEVRADLGPTLGLREVVAMGAKVTLEGEPEALAEQIRAWRGGSQAGGEGGGGSRVPLRAEGIAIAWNSSKDVGLDATGGAVSRDANGYKVAFETAQARHRDLSVALSSVSTDFDPKGTLRSAKAATASVSWDAPAPAESPEPRPPSATDPAPPPSPLAALPAKKQASRRGGSPPPAASAPPVEAGPLLALPDLHALRAKVALASTALGARLPDESAIAVDGMSVQMRIRGDAVAIGPGPLSLARHGDRLHVTFSTERSGASTPLSVSADLPVGAGDVTASLAGGPISLRLLGVREGAAGLTDVDRGTVAGQGKVVLAANAESLTFDGELNVRGASIKQPRLATDIVRNLDFSVSARGVLSDAGHLRLDDAEAAMGALHMRAHGTVEQTTEHLAAAVGFEVPAASCQALIESAPPALIPLVRSARMTGTFGARGRLAFDTKKIDDLVLDYDIDDRCHMTEVSAELSRDRFTHEFSHRIYLPDGTTGEDTTGPGSSNWSDLEHISPFMQAAVLTTEDGAFFRHHGFNHPAIRNSLVANLKARRFVRGASTITMQLAKNLFLSREKTLSRKIEELILTDYLEQIFRKDDMMELYLNVIEFGPSVYGITHAAEHYFGRKPEELNLAECLFLSSILPSPIRYHGIRDKGEVPEYWMKHIHQLMEIAAKNGKITKEELAEGLAQPILFYKDTGPRPTPRPASLGSKHGENGDEPDDVEWRPLD